MYKPIDLGGYDPTGSWKRDDPFTTAYCRTLQHGELKVTGGYLAVTKHLRTLGPMLVVMAFWYEGHPRCLSPKIINTHTTYYFHNDACGDKKWHLKRSAPYEELESYNKIPNSFPRILKQMAKKRGGSL